MRVFVGFDSREAVAYHTCVQSIIEKSPDPTKLQITPVSGPMRDGSNAFIYARFWIPYLCGYKGTALWLDGDMIVRAPVEDLAQMQQPGMAVQCVKHDYKTKHPVKYLGYKNEDYPRKNWSSVMLWNCAHPSNKVLTPEYVANSTGSHLHRFGWLSDQEIGALPESWNRLVLEQEIKPDDAILHYTIGTPCFTEYRDADGAEEWLATYNRMIVPMEAMG